MNTIYCVSPNNRIIRAEQCIFDEQNPSEVITTDCIKKAVSSLSASGLKLYCFMCSNLNNGTFIANSVQVCETCGMSRRTYTRAYKELTEKGYILQDRKNKRFYTFFPNGK